MIKYNVLSYKRCRYLFNYDSKNGNLIWKNITSNRASVGRNVGNKYGQRIKYIQTSVDCKKFLVHRLVWLWHNKKMPKWEIGHIDGDSLNNRIENLGDITSTQNNMNLSKRSDNSSGFTGVSMHNGAKKWVVQIQIDGNNKYFGLFEKLSDAIKKRKEINKKYGFHPNHGREKICHTS